MENNRYNVIISKRAVDMLQNHSRFLANVSEKAANEFVIDFYNSVKSLEFMPQRNQYLNHIELAQNKYRKIVIKRRYMAIYQIKNNYVYVDYVLDCREDYRWLL